ncbi:MAG: hypothetical protein KF894_08865 [Labilithrix sp.]|nr:hypothetical protein [Labilithrix sp.]
MSDRDIIKKQDQGVLNSSGLANPRKAIGELNEETFVFDLDADAGQAERGITCRKPFVVRAVELTPSTALAAHASNYTTFTARKRPAGALGTPATVAALSTNSSGGVSLVAWTKAAMPLSATAADRKFAVGDVLTVLSAETGTPTSPIGTVAVTVEYL